MGAAIRHTYPMDEEKLHVFAYPPVCLCCPDVHEYPVDGIEGSRLLAGLLIAHHAFDGRPTKYPPVLH